MHGWTHSSTYYAYAEGRGKSPRMQPQMKSRRQAMVQRRKAVSDYHIYSRSVHSVRPSFINLLTTLSSLWVVSSASRGPFRSPQKSQDCLQKPDSQVTGVTPLEVDHCTVTLEGEHGKVRQMRNERVRDWWLPSYLNVLPWPDLLQHLNFAVFDEPNNINILTNMNIDFLLPRFSPGGLCFLFVNPQR